MKKAELIKQLRFLIEDIKTDTKGSNYTFQWDVTNVVIEHDHVTREIKYSIIVTETFKR